MVAFVRVASVRDVPPGKMMTVQVNDQPVVLANVDGTIYASSSVCSHADGPLGGKFLADIVACPLHGGQFEVRTGKAVMPPATDDIPTFEVQIEGEDIKVASP